MSSTPPDCRSVSATVVRDMLASLQEAVVTADSDHRRRLLKGVIAHLQEVLAAEPSS